MITSVTNVTAARLGATKNIVPELKPSPDDLMAQARLKILRLQAKPEHHATPQTPSVSVFSRLKNWVSSKFTHKG